MKKPAKPRKDFPLFPHQNGQWCKKIKGRQHYFGKWADPKSAETEYLRVKEYLAAGKPVPTPDSGGGLRMARLCSAFLEVKESKVESGELSNRTFRDYHSGCAEVLELLGNTREVSSVGPAEFLELRAKLSKGRGLHAIGRAVTLVRMLFSFAYENAMIEKPVQFGKEFVRPSKKSLRVQRVKAQRKNGLRMLEASEIMTLLGSASAQMKAMIFLGINGGLGNTDLAGMTKSCIRGKWLTLPRIKTGADRRIPLWPETLEAVKEALESRPKPKSEEHDSLVFVTKYGVPWVRTGPSGKSNIDKITDSFNKLLVAAELKRPGLSFYALRHTFETVGGGSGDQVSTSSIMGHIDQGMSAMYRETIEDARLLRVTEHVRRWLFEEKEDAGT